MSERLLIVVTNSDPRNPSEIVEPIYNATVAASMDYHVEMIFSGRAGEVLVKDVAEEVPTLKEDQNVATLLAEALDAGVLIKASKNVVTHWGKDNLLPVVEDVVGAGYIISEVMNNETKSLCY